MKVLPIIARVLAIAIAIAGLIDPAIDWSRLTRPEVAVVAARVDSAMARSVAKTLSDKYTVIDGAFANAAATVLVGGQLPADRSTLAPVVFAVAPTDSTLAIEQVVVPRQASVETRVPVEIALRLPRARSKFSISLLNDGLTVDRAQISTGDGARTNVRLTFVPSAIGLAKLTVVARAEGTDDSTAVDAVVNVVDDRRAVLFFDRRPSWMSTFVRRSLEGDRQFSVASRVMTSRGISTESGQPPSSLEDPTLLELYDVIVVGAPDALTTRDVAGLETFLRKRGGGVALLFDERPRGGTYDRLTGVGRWSGGSSGVAMTVGIAHGDTTGLRATELAWPVSEAFETELLTTAAVGTARDRRPIIWSVPAGAGTVVVNGALDAWKFRDASTSGFDRFWRTTIARAGANAMPAVEAKVLKQVVEPGAVVELRVGVRDARLAERNQTARAAVSAVVEGSGGVDTIRMWPGERVGELTGTLRAPSAPGSYLVRVTANGGRAEVPFVVAGTVAEPRIDEREIVETVARSRGGQMAPVTEIEDALAKVVRGVVRRERVHPMQSGWWILPFVGLLGFDWWWRRKQGLA